VYHVVERCDAGERLAAEGLGGELAERRRHGHGGRARPPLPRLEEPAALVRGGYERGARGWLGWPVTQSSAPTAPDASHRPHRPPPPSLTAVHVQCLFFIKYFSHSFFGRRILTDALHRRPDVVKNE
jgi:hypothetical protein